MALTRPKLQQFDTTISSISDPITVLKAGTAQANVDIGFLMNRANGLVSNVAIYWNESGNTFVTAFTSNSGTTNSNITPVSYANVTTGALSITPAVTLNSTSTTTGALVVQGGVGVTGNIYTTGNVYGNSRIGFTWSANTTSAVYQVFNAATNSLDTVFG